MSGIPPSRLTRRAVLGGLLATSAHAALAEAPGQSPRPLPRGATAPVTPVPTLDSEALIVRAGLSGDTSVAVYDVATGDLLEGRHATHALPPASTMKAVTALYALDRLGPQHRFATRILTTGTLANGRLEGDLILAGGGDPTLDTDRMAELAVAMREAGLREVRGRFLVWGGALPYVERIDTGQPDYVGYNPSVSGLNLNYNRVHFEWKRNGDGYGVTMEARALRFSPATSVAHMAVVERKTPVYEYRRYAERDTWTVAKGALGSEGARWLPVRFPVRYAADVFRTLARSNGITLPMAEMLDGALPAGATPLVSTESETLKPMLESMLRYSTNLTAEVTGLSSTAAHGASPSDLRASGHEMEEWAMARFGIGRLAFHDHSGLGYGSEVSAGSLGRIMTESPDLAPLLKSVNLGIGSARPAPDGVSARAKTGTLNFVSSLTGFVTTRSGRELAFAILAADTERRDAIPPAERERPRGAKGWSNRARQLQKELIRNWAARFDT